MAGAQDLTGDPEIRGPLSWTTDARNGGFTTGQPYRALATNVATHTVQSQQRDPQSIWAFYRDMLALRNAYHGATIGAQSLTGISGSFE